MIYEVKVRVVEIYNADSTVDKSDIEIIKAEDIL